MEPLTLLLGGALFLAWKRRNEAPALPPAPAAPPPPAPAAAAPLALPDLTPPPVPEGVQKAVETVGKVFATAVVAASTALAVSEGAGELDKLLGGDGKSGTRIVLSGGLGGTAFVGVSLIMLSVLKVAAIALSTAFMATGIGALITAAVWVVVVVFEDIGRLSFGQPGAFRELKAMQFATQQQLYFSMKGTSEPLVNELGQPLGNPDGSPIMVPISDDECVRRSEQGAVGYITEWNRIRYETWMKRPWGIGVTSRAYHAQFGRDRGYFVGWTDGNGNLHVDLHAKHGVPFPGLSLDRSWVERYVPAAERTTFQSTVRRVKTITTAQQQTNLATVISSGGLTLLAQQKSVSTGGTVYVTTQEWEVVPVTILVDSKFEEFLAAGRVFANVIAFIKWMKEEPHGMGVDDLGHARYGAAHGRFAGTVDDRGRLLLSFTGAGGLPKTAAVNWKSGQMEPA